MHRHKGLDWENVQARLEANAAKLWSLNEMEATSGEPDVMIVKVWIPEKNISRKIMRWRWQPI